MRAVEALNAAFAFPSPDVLLLDGGTLGLNLLEYVESSRRVLVFDAIDFGLPPGALRVLRDDEVPRWGARKMSPHQNGFNDVLALAQLHGRTPDSVVAIGVQPPDAPGLRRKVDASPSRMRLAEAVTLAAAQLADWGPRRPPRARSMKSSSRSNAGSLALSPYEGGRPSAEDACRIGDPRLLGALWDASHVHWHSDAGAAHRQRHG